VGHFDDSSFSVTPLATYQYWPVRDKEGRLVGLQFDDGSGPAGWWPDAMPPDVSWRPLLDLLDVAEARDWDRLACWWGVRWLLSVVPVPEDPPWISVMYARTPEQRAAAYRLAVSPDKWRTVPIVWIPQHGHERIADDAAYRPVGWLYGFRPRFNDYAIVRWYGVAPDGWPPLGVTGGVRPPNREEDAELEVLAVRATLQLAKPGLRIGLEWRHAVRSSLVVFQDDQVRRAVFDEEFLAVANAARKLLSVPERLSDEPRVEPVAFPSGWRTHVRFGRTDVEAWPPTHPARREPLQRILQQVAESDPVAEAESTVEEAHRRGRGRVAHVAALIRGRLQCPVRERALLRYIPPKVIMGYATDNFLGLLWQQVVWAVEARMTITQCEGCRGWTMRAPRPGEAKVGRPALCMLCEMELTDDASGSTRREAYFAWRRRQRRLGATTDTTVARYLTQAMKRTRGAASTRPRG